MGGWNDVPAVISNLATAGTIVRALIDAERTFDKAELKLKLADVMVSLADARVQLSDIQAAMDSLAFQLREANAKLTFAGTMEYVRPYYMNTAGGKRDGPYCPTCWDGRERLAIRLYQAGQGFWECHTCDKHVRDSTYSTAPLYSPRNDLP
jgi:ribosomal protein L37AE/L43A